jgi:photosystem II cytochrome c550
MPQFFSRALVLILSVCLAVFTWMPAWAAVDPYVARYLDVAEPVPLSIDDQGQTRSFSAADLSEGIQLFQENCKNCHVGGATLPDPTVPLSIAALQAAMPPRDNINSLVAFLRQPMTYDGSQESDWCRQVPESWMSQTQVEHLAAFILRAAQEAPGWGESRF